MEKEITESTLRMLIKQGLVETHPHTLQKVKTLYGSTITAMYIDHLIDPVTKTESSIVTHKGRTFITRFISGCFFPYVFERLD